MSAGVSIDALKSGHDRLASLVKKLTDEDLARPSGAREWDVSQVLGHLGSGSVIGLATVDAAAEGKPNPGFEFNKSVWAQWDSLSPRERASGFLTASEKLVSRYAAMDAVTRESLKIDLGFMPFPVDVKTAANMRLSELTLHSWDVHVAFDPAATLGAEAVEPLLENTTMLLSRLAKPGFLQGVVHVTLTSPDREFTLNFGEQVTLDNDVPDRTDGTLTLPGEAWLRLVAGRLGTSWAAEVSGIADLGNLRKTFPGY